MSRPIITGSAGQYVLTWEAPEPVAIHVSRPRTDRSGGTSAEIRVELPALEHPHLHQARLNLTSSEARRRLAAQLAGRHPADWDAILEQLTVLVLEREREGEPVTILRPTDRVAPVRFLLPPFLPEKEVTVIFAEGGSAKSLLALLCGILVASGESHDALGWTPDEKRQVLLLDFETTAEEHRRRLSRLAQSLALSGDPAIHYRRSYIPLADDLDAVQRCVQEKNIEFLIVDSAGPASGADIFTPEAPIALFRALRRLGVTTLLLAHTAKGNVETNHRTPFGSVFFFNLPRSVWELRRYQAPGEDSLRLGLFHRKSNVSRLSRPIGLEFTFDDEEGPITVGPADITEIPGVCEGLPVGRRIENLLPYSGPMRPKEIAVRLGVSDAAARTALKRLHDRGVVTVLPNGLYAAAVEEEVEVPF